MICQSCGNSPAVVHLEESHSGKRVHLWLCVECAEKRKAFEEDALGDNPEFSMGDDLDFQADSGLASFFGQAFDGEEPIEGQLKHCPSCGFSLDQLSRTNRLGCSGCYDFFRPALLPMLARLHRHSSHLGKVPQTVKGRLSPKGEIARHRVALEKAIVAENFEDAARLRDLIIRLEGRTEQKPMPGPSADSSKDVLGDGEEEL